MTKVITYGTYDLLHIGHIRLLERAKELGDYLIVGVTADGFDMSRGKINVRQSLMERVEAVRATGIADEIIIEEYEGQKIDDINRYDVDIFTVGSDWEGQFDYLQPYCKVIYLERTEGISSSELRTKDRKVSLGIVGESAVLNKFASECQYVNGLQIKGICTLDDSQLSDTLRNLPCLTDTFSELLEEVEAVYIASHPYKHYEQVKKALLAGKHVLCELPIAMNRGQFEELCQLAEQKHCVLTEAIKTAYSTAYFHLMLLVKSGKIGRVISVDATCTSLQEINVNKDNMAVIWNSICAWGPTALLPVFQILGTDYKKKQIVSYMADLKKCRFDYFTKIDFVYSHAVASIKVGKGVKSEGELIISGTNGYVYVPAPWWKTDYFEIRYENPADNRRYFYQLEGEGIRLEVLSFIKSIEKERSSFYVDREVTTAIAQIMGDFETRKDCLFI